MALLLGISFLVVPVYRVLVIDAVKLQDAPHYRLIFGMMALVESVFIVVLFATAVQFIKGSTSGANLYSVAVLILIAFEVGTGMLGRAGGIGLSIAAASGGVGSGTGPFEFLFLVPFLYPIFSVILVQAVKQRHSPA